MARVTKRTSPILARLVRGPYIELFARSRAKGWGAWGAEVGKFG